MIEKQNRETLATVISRITPEDIYGRPNAPAYDAEKFKGKLLSVAVRKRNEIIRDA
jgi:hypothetical protein